MCCSSLLSLAWIQHIKVFLNYILQHLEKIKPGNVMVKTNVIGNTLKFKKH